MTSRLAVFTLSLLLSLAVAAEQLLETIQLHNKTPQEIISAIKPMMPPDVALSGIDNRLVVRATAGQIQEIKKILSEIDLPAKQIVVEVRQGAGMESIVDQASTGRSKVTATTGSRGIQASTRGARDVSQQIRTLDGKPAFISVGQSIPTYDYPLHIFSYNVYQQNRYRDVTSGFLVVPKVDGNQVTLAIHQHGDARSQETGVFDIQSAHSVVRGRMGEWINLGYSGASLSSNGRSGIRAYTNRDTDRIIQVRVTPVAE